MDQQHWTKDPTQLPPNVTGEFFPHQDIKIYEIRENNNTTI